MSSVSTDNYRTFTKSIGEVQEDLKKQAKRAREDQVAETKDLKESYEKDLVKKVSNFEDEKSRLADEGSERYAKIRAQNETNREDISNESYDRFGKFVKETHQDQEKFRENAIKTDKANREKQADLVKDFSKTLEKKEEQYTDRTRDRDYKAKIKNEREREDLSSENEKLSTALNTKNVIDGERTAKLKMTEAKEQKSSNEALARKFEGQLDSERKHTEELDHIYSRKTDDIITARERGFTKAISELNKQNADDKKQLKEEMDLSNRQWQSKIKKERETTESSYMRQMTAANEARNDALKKQALNYGDAMARSREADSEKIKRLDKQLSEMKTTSDPNSISPGAENALAKKYAGKYEPLLEKEKEISDKKLSGANQRYYHDVAQIRTEEQSKQSKMQADMMAKSQEERGQIQTFVKDQQERESAQNVGREAASQRKLEDITAKYARVFNEHRSKTDESMELSRMDALSKLKGVREDYELESRKKDRMMVAHTQDLIRGYEKKIQDQRNERDDILSQMKLEFERESKEADKKGKIALEDQARNYDIRIDQINAQYAERERLANQSHEDEIERLRRTNALLIKKKS